MQSLIRRKVSGAILMFVRTKSDEKHHMSKLLARHTYRQKPWWLSKEMARIEKKKMVGMNKNHSLVSCCMEDLSKHQIICCFNKSWHWQPINIFLCKYFVNALFLSEYNYRWLWREAQFCTLASTMWRHNDAKNIMENIYSNSRFI